MSMFKKMLGLIMCFSMVASSVFFSLNTQVQAAANATPDLITGAGDISNFPTFDDDNLIMNGSFEMEGSGQLGWMNNLPARFTVVDNPSGAPAGGGNRYLKYDASEPSYQGGGSQWFEARTDEGQSYAPINVLPNSEYELSFWAKLEYTGLATLAEIDAKKVQIVQIRNESNGDHIPLTVQNTQTAYNHSDNPFKINGGWHQITKTFNTGNYRRLYFKGIRATDNIPGMVYYYDDFTLKRLGDENLSSIKRIDVTNQPANAKLGMIINAVGDGSTSNTQAIQNAIDVAATLASPGNNVEVYFPAGTYLTSMIALQSNVTLLLADGVTIKADPDSLKWRSAGVPLIFGHNVRNAYIKAETSRVTSIGSPAANAPTINCSGLSFSEPNGDRKNGNRPHRTLEIKHSKGIRVEGINFRETLFWTTHYDNCDYVFIDKLDIRNPRDSYIKNTDGIDINGCRNVTVQNCFIEVGDDAVCLKNINPGTGTGGAGIPEEPLPRPTMHNILVQNCTLATECNATKIGTETVGDIRDVLFQDITVNRHSDGHRSALAAIAFQSNDGNTVENITARRYTINDTQCPVFLILQDRTRSGHPDRPIGAMQDILVEDITAHKSTLASEVNVAEGQIIERVTFRNWNIKNEQTDYSNTPLSYPTGSYPEAGRHGTSPAYGLFVRNVAGLTLDDLIFTDIGNSKRVDVYQQNITPPRDPQYYEDLAECEAARDSFGFTLKALTGNIILPDNSGDPDVTLTWQSSAPTVINAGSGVVTRPDALSGNTNVTLTAKFSKGTAFVTKDYPVTVLSRKFAEADTYQDSGNSSAINGSSEEIVVNSTTDSYLRFDTGEILGTIEKVSIRLRQTDGTAAVPEELKMYGVNDDWTEAAAVSGLSDGDLVTTAELHTLGIYDFDVTSYFKDKYETADGVFSVKLSTTGSGSHTFASKETVSSAPELIIKLEGGENPYAPDPLPNMLTNGGFCGDTESERMQGWLNNFRSSSQTSKFSLTNNDTLDGGYALKCESPANSGDGRLLFEREDPILVVPNTFYVFSFWFKGVLEDGSAPLPWNLPTSITSNGNHGPQVQLMGRKGNASFDPNNGNNHVVLMILKNHSGSDSNLETMGVGPMPFTIDGQWHKVTYIVRTRNRDNVDVSELFLNVRSPDAADKSLTYYYDDFHLRPLGVGEIINGGFEYGIQPWFLDRGDTNTVISRASDPANVKSGAGSLQIQTGASAGRTTFNTHIRLRPYTQYRLLFSYKHNGGGTIRVMLGNANNRWDAQGDLLQLDINSESKSGEWQTFSETFNSDTAERMSLRLLDRGSGTGVWHFDDVKLEKVSGDEWVSASDVMYAYKNDGDHKRIEVNALFENYTSVDKKPLIATALYNSDDEILDLQAWNYTFAAEQTHFFREYFLIPNDLAEGTYIKTFVWDGKTIAPYAKKAANYDAYK